MLNHVLPQVVLAAFTQNFYFSFAMQVLVNFSFFNVILPPFPIEYEFIFELNVIFALAQIAGAWLGIAASQLAAVPPILEVSAAWSRPRWAWPGATWLRAAFCVVVLLCVVPGVSYDFGVSVWTPGCYATWGLIVSAELVVCYLVSYWILTCDVGPGRPFRTRPQLRRFLLVLAGTHLLFVNGWWPVNAQHQQATTLVWAMLVLIVTSFLIYLVLAQAGAVRRNRRDDLRHGLQFYYKKKYC